MKTLSIDASTSHVGYCLSDDDGYLCSGQYQPQGESGNRRIVDFMTWLCGCIQTEDVSRVFYERASGAHGNKSTDRLLGALEFATWLVCDKNDCALLELSPKEVKATEVYKCFNGNNVDLMRLSRACEYAPFDVIKKADGTINASAMERQDDEIDAIGIYLAGVKRYG